MIEKLKDIASANTIQMIKRDKILEKLIEKFSFLVEDFNFKKLRMQHFGKGAMIIFSRKGKKYPIITMKYEMATLPSIELQMNAEDRFNFTCEKEMMKYPFHLGIQNIVHKKINSIDEYISELGDFWRAHEKQLFEEMGLCLDSLASQVRETVSSNL